MFPHQVMEVMFNEIIKSHMKHLLLFATSIYLLAACSGFEQYEALKDIQYAGDVVERVIFDVLPLKDIDEPETKASAVPSADGRIVSFQWEVTDTVGIFPDTGSQIYFTMEDGVGSSSAVFTGGGWALKNNSTYVSYYPFVADFYLKSNKIPLSFTGQKQVGTTAPFVGARYYLASDATSSDNGVLSFTYNTLNTIINVKATLPAGTYVKATLTLDDPLFVEEGTYDLASKTITGTKYSRTLEIDLEDFTLTEQSQVPIYIMSAPVDMANKVVTVKIYRSDGKKYRCLKTPPSPYQAGVRYGLVCAMEEFEDGNNVIRYTSTDGQIVTPYRSDVFGANIISNEYVDGEGRIEFDGDVTSIGDYAFYDKSTLSSIIIPNSVTTIGDYAFYCTWGSNLTGNLDLPEGLTSIGEDAFSGCSGFTGDLILPAGLTSIGYGSFAFCSGFTGDLVLSAGLTSIGRGVFAGCSGFTCELFLPAGLTSIGESAFCGCSGFYGSLSLPAGLTTIGNYAFSDCSGFYGSLILPECLTSIGDYAFSNCSGFTGELTLPAGLKSIGNDAFSGCSGFKGDLTLPSGLTSIGDSAFDGCSGFTGDLILPAGLTSIGDYAFDGCEGLTGDLTLPDGLTSIGDYAFRGCSGFTGDLTLPEGLTSIGNYAFHGCGGLDGVLSLPSSLTLIRQNAFDHCYALTSIIISAVAPPNIAGNAFNNTNNCPIYVPTGTVDTYKTASGWKNYADRIFSSEGGVVPPSGDGGDE
jgi:hypothetical protein